MRRLTYSFDSDDSNSGGFIEHVSDRLLVSRYVHHRLPDILFTAIVRAETWVISIYNSKLVTLYGMLLLFGNISKEGLKLSKYWFWILLIISFVTVALETCRKYYSLSEPSEL